MIDEAWKLIERPATGRWFNEFCRRSRHQALWLIAISQQLSDFDNEHGKALLANAAMRLFLRQEARELAYVKEALALSERGDRGDLPASDGARALLDGLPDERVARTGNAADRRSVQLEYWIASSDPARDEHVRQRALRESDEDPWRALELLIDERLAGRA